MTSRKDIFKAFNWCFIILFEKNWCFIIENEIKMEKEIKNFKKYLIRYGMRMEINIIYYLKYFYNYFLYIKIIIIITFID